jgi:glycosyltransferase involved in cell wall biosynthesis
MRIAIVSEHASPLASLGEVDAGGQNVYVAALSDELARRGHEVTVHTRRDDPSLPEVVRLASGVAVHHVDAGPATRLPKDELWPLMEEFADGLARAWSGNPPDVVHAHFWMSGFASVRAASRCLHRPAVVQTFHALGVVKRRQQGSKDTSPAERRTVEAQLVAACDRVVATCTDELFELVRLGADTGRVSVVPCGVDLDVFGAEGPTCDRDPARSRVVVVSRLVERKGVGNVVEAVARLDDVELVVVGGPVAEALGGDPEAVRLRRLAAELGVADRVRFVGQQSRHNVARILRSADVAVSVPWYEPFGIVPLEAMACGVPVVGSAVGGLIDTVVDGLTGVLVPPRDPTRLAEELGDLLADSDRRTAMGRAGRRRVVERYRWSTVARGVEAAYRRTLGTAHASATAEVAR